MDNSSEKWLKLGELLEMYSPFRIAKLGYRYINPNDIIGFSLSETEILNSGKLNGLSEKVKKYDWQPVHLRDFELILLPNSKYTVGHGGNHRAYLSKKLNLNSIPAHVEVLVREKDISEYTKIKIKELEQEKSDIENKARILNNFLRDKDPNRELYKDEEDELFSLNGKADLKDDIISQLLLIEANKLGYLSNELLNENSVI